MIEQAAALAAERGVHNVRFELGNAEELPFPDATFDAAFENTLLEHVAGPRRVVDEMCRVLKPGGIIGLRDGDLGGQLIYPSNRIVEEVWTLYDRLWRHNGGNPEQGRLQRGLLRTAGFGELQTSAGATINFAPAYLRVLTDPHFEDRVIALGWAKPAMIERYTQALGEWAANPDAFGAAVAIETVGWKV
jgi:SAM-dependent methyltransferase